MLSLSGCIPWMTVGLVESVAIVTLNLCTIIVFIRNRTLRKRSMYFVINLAVIDMLVGGFGAFDLLYLFGLSCSVFTVYSMEDWTYYLLLILLVIFPFFP